MAALIVLAVILGLLALFLLVPARVRVQYSKDVTLWAGVGPVTLRLWPPRPSKKRKKPKTKRRRVVHLGKKSAPKVDASTDTDAAPDASAQAEAAPKATKARAMGGVKGMLADLTLEKILAYVRLGKAALGRMASTVRIRRLKLHAVIAGEDPGKTALAYGGATATVNLLIPLLEGHINWRATDVLVEADFAGQAGVELDATVTIMPIVVLVAGLRLLLGFVKVNRAEADTAAGTAQNNQAKG